MRAVNIKVLSEAGRGSEKQTNMKHMLCVVDSVYIFMYSSFSLILMFNIDNVGLLGYCVNVNTLASPSAGEVLLCSDLPAARPNISESHSETPVLEYPSSTPFPRTKGYLRVLHCR